MSWVVRNKCMVEFCKSVFQILDGAGRFISTELERDFPDVYDGARGVRFIEKVVESSRSEVKWLGFG